MPLSSAPSVANFRGTVATGSGQLANASVSAALVSGNGGGGKGATIRKPAESTINFQSLFAALQIQISTASLAPIPKTNDSSPANARATDPTAISAQGTQNADKLATSTPAAVSPSSPGLQPTAISPDPGQSTESTPILHVPDPAPTGTTTLPVGQQSSPAKESPGTNQQQGLAAPWSKWVGVSPDKGVSGSRKDAPAASGDQAAIAVDPLNNGFAGASNASIGGNAGSALFNPRTLLTALAGSSSPVTVVDPRNSTEALEARNHASQSALKESSVPVRFASLMLPAETHTAAVVHDAQPLHGGTDVSGQIASGIIARAQITTREGQTDFRLRLEPPELGTIRVHLSATDQGISARLVVHEEVAHQLIESQLESLRQRLTNAGISLGSFDVSQGGTGSRDAQKQHDPGSVVAPLDPSPNRPKATPSSPVLARGSTSTIDLIV